MMCYFWLSLVIFGYTCLSLAILGSLWQSLGISGYLRLSLPPKQSPMVDIWKGRRWRIYLLQKFTHTNRSRWKILSNKNENFEWNAQCSFQSKFVSFISIRFILQIHCGLNFLFVFEFPICFGSYLSNYGKCIWTSTKFVHSCVS